MAQDFYDPLQVLDYITTKLDDNKADLGVRYVAKLDEELFPKYPALLVTMETPLERVQHGTRVFLVNFNVDIWVFHAQLTQGKAVRSEEDIALATAVRKLMHADYELGGHIVFGFIHGEFPGRVARIVGGKAHTVSATRLMWTGQNRVLYQDS